MRLNAILLLVLVGCASAQPKPSPLAEPQPAPVVAAPEAPPPPAVAEQPANGIPAALPMADPSMLAVLRIKEPLDIAHRLGFSNEVLRQKILPGFNPADVHPGNAALFVWEPLPDAGIAPGLMALLPAAADSAFAQHLQASFKGLKLQQLGNDALGAMDPALLSQKLKDGPALRQLSRTPTRDDIVLDVNLVSFLARYGGPMREFLERNRAQMETQTQGMNTGKQLTAFLDSLANYATLTFGTRILPQDFRFSLVTREKTPAPEAAPRPAPAIEAVRYLPAGVMRMQASGRMLEKSASLLQGFYGNLTPGSPDLTSAFGDNFAAQARLAKSTRQLAFSFSLSTAKLIHLVGIADSSDPNAARDLMEQNVKRMNDPKVQSDLKKQHLSCSVKLRKAVRKLEGQPVDRMETSCKPVGEVATESSAFLKKLYPLIVETVRIGDLEVTEINGSGEGDLARIAHDVVSGAPAGSALAASTVFSEPGFVQMDLDVSRLIRELNQLFVATNGSTRLPEPDPSLTPIVAHGRESDGATEYRGQISKATVAAISEVFRQIAPKSTKP